MQSKHKQIVNIADENLMDYSFLRILSRYHSTKSKNYLKDDIEFVTEFPCLLEHPVFKIIFDIYSSTCISLKTIIIIFPWFGHFRNTVVFFKQKHVFLIFFMTNFL